MEITFAVGFFIVAVLFIAVPLATGFIDRTTNQILGLGIVGFVKKERSYHGT